MADEIIKRRIPQEDFPPEHGVEHCTVGKNRIFSAQNFIIWSGCSFFSLL